MIFYFVLLYYYLNLVPTLIIFDEKCASLDTNNLLYELQDIGSQINHSIDE